MMIIKCIFNYDDDKDDDNDDDADDEEKNILNLNLMGYVRKFRYAG